MKTTIIKLHIATIIALYPTSGFSHGGEDHIKTPPKEVVKHQRTKSDALKEAYQKINDAYLVDIKPIFEKKCFDCHGDLKKSPWYYKVPGIKQMIDYDMKEAKEHIDMRQDFPFISHENPLKDLKSIKEIGEEGGMPPLRYILGHWDARLSEAEKKSIVTWSSESIKRLQP